MKAEITALIGAGCLALALAAAPAMATTVVRIDVAEMTRYADRILIATAVSSHSVWRGGRLYTQVDLTVHETLKGQASMAASVLLPGGVDVHRAVPVAEIWPGQPTLEIGERALVFLRSVHEGDDYETILGLSQGKFTILDDGEGGAQVLRDLQGLRLAGPGGVARGGLDRRSLDSLEGEIRRHLTGAGGEER